MCQENPGLIFLMEGKSTPHPPVPIMFSVLSSCFSVVFVKLQISYFW